MPKASTIRARIEDQGKGIVRCEDADDVFRKLGI